MAMKLFSADWFLHARTGRLVLVFFIFILIQLAFAALYFQLYRQNRTNFTFGSDILKSQSAAASDSTELTLKNLRGAIEALQEASFELDHGSVPVVKSRTGATLELPSGRKCVMIFLSGPPAGGGAGSRLRIIDIEGKALMEIDPSGSGIRGWLESAAWLSTPADWQAAIPRILEDLEEKEEVESSILESISTPFPDVWSYWDFLYFSTIVQTTVGFGDILPNSTRIRMLVAVHILIGYALLIVVLNVVLDS